MQRKIIPKEIKDEILAKVRTGGKVLDLAKMYGLADRTIYAWLQRDAVSSTRFFEHFLNS